MAEENTQETKKATKLSLVEKVALCICASLIGLCSYGMYQHPLIYLRPHAEQTVERTVRGVTIYRKEHKRFDGVLGGTILNAVYSELGFNAPRLDIFAYGMNSPNELYIDYGNDGKVEGASINGNVLERERNPEFFETIDSRFADYKKRLNADEVIAEKMKEAPPTIEELMGE